MEDTWKHPTPLLVKDLQSTPDPPESLIKKTYQKWADSYDKDSECLGYASHKTCVKSFNNGIMKIYGEKRARSIRIIDVGAGTGALGELLKERGYTNVDGIDCSDEMLQKARDKKVYKNTFVSFIDDKRNELIQDASFDALISSAAISPTLIQPRAFDEMIRWISEGGVLCFTIRKSSFDNARLGYKAKFKEFEDEKKWKMISREVVDYYLYEKGEEYFGRKAYIFVYQKL